MLLGYLGCEGLKGSSDQDLECRSLLAEKPEKSEAAAVRKTVMLQERENISHLQIWGSQWIHI